METHTFDDKNYVISLFRGFGLVSLHGVSTIAVYLMPNPFYTYILNI